MLVTKRKYNKLLQENKQLKKTIKSLDTLNPAICSLTEAVHNYEKYLYTVAENETKYIHALFKTIIGMINKNKIKIIQDINAETEAMHRFTVEAIIKDMDKNV